MLVHRKVVHIRRLSLPFALMGFLGYDYVQINNLVVMSCRYQHVNATTTLASCCLTSAVLTNEVLKEFIVTLL